MRVPTVIWFLMAGLKPEIPLQAKSTIELIVAHGDHNIAGTSCNGMTFTQNIKVENKVNCSACI